MGNIFKNKFFIILLIIVCVLTLSTIILNLLGYGSIVTDIVNLVLTPFQRFAVILKDTFSNIAAYFTEFNNMKDEIEDLKAQLEIARAQNQETWKLQEQIDMFQTFYGLKSKHMDYDLYPARITARDPGNYLSILTINIGSFHTVKKDMPVVAAQNIGQDKYIYMIVGYISETGILSSKVVTFIRAGTSVGAYIEGTEAACIVEGEFELEKEGLCKVTVLSNETVLKVGDRIYTSGNGDIYPEDLYIGEIIEIEPEPLSHTMIGYIKPAVDFGGAKDVMVILDSERKFY